jgi:hypothetical protein
MLLMAAPAVWLGTSKLLVWSEAWNAEGEKGKSLLLFQGYALQKLRAAPSLRIFAIEPP